MSGTRKSRTFGKQIGLLFDLGALGAMPDRGLLGCSPVAERRRRPRLPRWLSVMGRWCSASAGMRWPMGISPRMPFRSRSCYWRGGTRSIHDPDALAGWLHRVGRRVRCGGRESIGDLSGKRRVWRR